VQRFLLFDMGCSICENVAQDIEMAAGGWLLARGLQDAEMSALLKQYRPGLLVEIQPALLEVDGDRVKVRTGVALSWSLLLGLGPQRARRVLSLALGAARLKDAQAGVTRRSLLASAGAVATVMGLGAFPSAASAAVINAPMTAGATFNRLVSRASAHPSVRSAQQRLYGEGYSAEHTTAVVVPQGDEVYLVMFFIGHAKKLRNHAGVIAHELGKKNNSTVVEYVVAEPDQLFAAERFNPGALKTSSTASAVEAAQASPASYISCLAFCVGANCQANAYKCRHLKQIYLVLACMIAVCGSKVRTCHRVCKSQW
jgi:hypothetical protein